MTRINEIKARLKAATPGPWDDKLTAVYKDCTAIRICGDFHHFKTDAAFIANAPSDISYLLSEIEQLERESADKEQSSMDEHNDVHYWRDKARVAEKELDRATAERDAAIKDLKIACACGESCAVCKNVRDRGGNFPCALGEWCYGEKWEWRGATQPNK